MNFLVIENTKIDKHKQCLFTLLSFNRRNFSSNFQIVFRSMLARSQEHFAIMAFHETRLNSNITSLFHLPGYNNNSYTQCRNTEGGGVALYIYI